MLFKGTVSEMMEFLTYATEEYMVKVKSAQSNQS
jgi:hypothetical protein